MTSDTPDLQAILRRIETLEKENKAAETVSGKDGAALVIEVRDIGGKG